MTAPPFMADLRKTAAQFLEPPTVQGSQEIHVELRDLVVHREAVAADEHLEQVQHRFAGTDAGYLAVLDHGKVIGICSRQDVAMQLGSQYGFALFGRTAIREHMIEDVLVISVDQDWQELLQEVFSRKGDRFNDDVVLVDGAGALLGLITVQGLIRLQTRLLLEAIEQLKRQRSEIERRNRCMTAELFMAQEIQRALQPKDFSSLCAQVALPDHGVQILAHYEPTAMVSGDFFDVLALNDSTLGILIADVMGHGVQAALVTAMLRALLQDHAERAADPAALLGTLNQNLCAILADIQDPVFVSAFAAALHVPSGSLTYANAGHPSPLLLRSSATTVESLDCAQHLNGGVMGINPDGAYHNAKIFMQSRDHLLIFTDGLFEVSDADGDILGEEGLLSITKAQLGQTGSALMAEVLAQVRHFSGQEHFSDDICLLVVGLD